MTRSMADATSGNIGNIPGNIDVVAGYVTGTPDVQWTPADWARFPDIPHVTIDQGATGSPVPSAIVRDFEQGAWTASEANEHIGNGLWTSARPTIYCDQANLPGIIADGWRRDLWVAIIGWQPGKPWPQPVANAIAVGCTIVAVQQQNVNGVYDLSVVLDPTWPNMGDDPMPIAIGAAGVAEIYLLDGGKMSHIADPASLTALTQAGVKQVTVTPAALTQFLADYPPGNPPVQVTVTG